MAYGGNRSKKTLHGTLQTTDATVTLVLTATIPSGHSIIGYLNAVSRNTANGNTKVFNGPVGGKNVSGTVTTASSITTIITDEATSVTITNSGNDLQIKATGIAATTIDWDFDFEYIEN